MSIWFSSDSHIPTNVVEVGNEISLNSLNGLSAASPPITATNPVVTVSGLSGYCLTPSASPTSSTYNQAYQVGSYSFNFSDNFYPNELQFVATDGQAYKVPARSASCPPAGSVASPAYVDLNSTVSGTGPNGEPYSNEGWQILYHPQYAASIADGMCGIAGSGGCPAAGQNVLVNPYNQATTMWFGDYEYEYQTDGSCGFTWVVVGGGGNNNNCTEGNPTGSTSTRSADIYISELGGWYSAGYYDTAEYTHADCTTYWGDTGGPYWLPYGTVIAGNGNCTYYSDGSGSYYEDCGSNPPPPPPSCTQGEATGNTSSTPNYVYITEMGGEYQNGYTPTAEYYNSDCSTYWESTGSVVYYEYGTYLTSDGANNFYSDGAGSYYYLPI